ncbi:uncharacterized protein CMU_042020 [Cryptosporidium muris RN66]|uniref:Uncharacterized protein n=1 Tax=Cryptosporidium muris (strain RN66) TaxID=441375 RepID=B6AA88_CRYMR|nr:uncharacterized protein CMU_042020 [Cryptosporidium muris RN66]EEA05129.1 hypothetical protein CMU_042020 [Cryptosporidium muris RN66]|eukprot:XP_002139478.1 hypothetical protein [Cryptosporidium muris RN66]
MAKKRIKKQKVDSIPLEQAQLSGFISSNIRDNENNVKGLIVQRESEYTSVSQDNEFTRLLREFDLNPIYGPSTDITRIERLNRAKKLRIPIKTNTEQAIIMDHSRLSTIDEFLKVVMSN